MSVYVCIPESIDMPKKTEITTGLQSKDLFQKEKFLNLLIIKILNDPHCEQLVMYVLNYVLPYQEQSRKLKKMLLLYWEIINKKKNNGTISDEFMMACNNLRKDLTHANEYVVGMSLKLIGRIHIKEQLESLLPSIYNKCLTHSEAFVRRNAVECLYELFNFFGEDQLPNLGDRMVELLEVETNLNTRRNAIVLLFKVDY